MGPHVGLFLFLAFAGSLTSNAEAMEGVDGATPDLADLFRISCVFQWNCHFVVCLTIFLFFFQKKKKAASASGPLCDRTRAFS